MKMSTKHFNPKPTYDRSETKDAFKARHPIQDVYGDPVPSDPVRDVVRRQSSWFIRKKPSYAVLLNYSN